MNSFEIKKYVLELSKYIRENIFSDFQTPSVRFDIKPSSKVAGIARFKEYVVDFNIQIAQMNGDAFKKTVEHELAHLMTYHVYKDTLKQQHGPEFRNMCKLLNNDGSTFTKGYVMPVSSNRQVTRHEYTCNCGSHYLTPATHRKLQTTSQQMKCRHCNTMIVCSNMVVKVSSNNPRFIKKES